MEKSLVKTILLIGAGQLGSRHLQGLLKLENKHNIYILDPSKESIILAKLRANEIKNEHNLIFVSEWNLLPSFFDLVIVATNSNIRELVVTQLLEGYKVKYLILEKVLFQEIESYERVSNLIKRKKVDTWVNHGRRLNDQYKSIKTLVREGKESVIFNLTGGNWGLACNSLHFLDLFKYITNSDIDEIDIDWLDNTLLDSKRKNYVEATGTLKGKTNNLDFFTITSFEGNASPLTISIATSSTRWIVEEGIKESTIRYFSKTNNYKEETNVFQIEFQSTLTTSVVKHIFETGKCDLPSYEDAKQTHLLFIKAILKKYNQITGLNSTICPIT